MKKTIGILGGMGPLATANLFCKIIHLTNAASDQENIRIFVDNNTEIPDRTAFILGKGSDPRPSLIESAQKLEMIGADCVVMPCNTAHCFYDDIVKSVNIPFLNMVDETLKRIHIDRGNIKTVGLLATNGTCESGLYNKYAEKYDIKIVSPSIWNQKAITKLVYDIKAGHCEFDETVFDDVLGELREYGCRMFILGCTEISVAYELCKMEGDFIDSLEVIAKKCIEFALTNGPHGNSVENYSGH